MTSNREHSVVCIFTCFVGKAEKVVRKIASQVHVRVDCKGDVATQQTYRRYYPSCYTDFM